MIFKMLSIAFLFFFSLLTQGQELSCKQLNDIQNRFLDQHAIYNKLSESLKKRVLEQFIKNLDREKIYFLQSDIEKIKSKNKKLFKNIRRGNCRGLYLIYNLYSQRVNERIAFALNYINQDFSLDKKMVYVLDEDLKKHPKASPMANQEMKKYVQYQMANIFNVEKDLKKSSEQFSYILNNIKKQVQSWKPHLSLKEKRACDKKSENSFKACRPTKWYSKYLDAYSQSLDSHSNYMDNEELEEFNITMNLELEGIGASLSSRFGYTTVEKIIPGGAADKSKKIKVKDKILAVGQNPKQLTNIFGERIEDVVSIIRGPRGTSVYLKISRKLNQGGNKVFTVRLIRDRVDLKEEEASISYHDIKYKTKNYKIGLIKVPSFYGSGILGKSVSRDVKKLLREAKSKKISALVLDLSYNRGGSLDEAVKLSGLFFSKGNVVKQSERKNNHTYTFKDLDEKVIYSDPLIVLVNRLSASASEIVSGTLQDYKRAVIVGGDHTFGKGSVQSVMMLRPKLGALKTTVGLYFIPSGKSTQKTGVFSDIAFPSVFNIDELGEKNLDYVLPSKTIKSFKSKSKDIFLGDKDNWKPVDSQIIEKLKLASQKRIISSKKFKKIKKDFKEIQERTKNKKKISVAEVLDNKEKDTEEELIESNIDNEKDKKKYFQRADVQEALNIAKDLVIFQNTKKANKPQTKKNPSANFYPKQEDKNLLETKKSSSLEKIFPTTG